MQVRLGKNRLTLPKKEIEAKIEKGSATFYSKDKNLITKYNDKKLLFIISNYLGNGWSACSRWENEKIDKNIPNTVLEYSKNMRGVDISNRMI